MWHSLLDTMGKSRLNDSRAQELQTHESCLKFLSDDFLFTRDEVMIFLISGKCS